MRDGWTRVALGDVATLDIERVPLVAGVAYQTAGVLNEGKGLFERQIVTAEDTTYSHFHRLRAGQLVMRKLTAFEGSIGIVPEELDGAFVSTEFPTFTLNQARIEPRYMALVCRQPSFWHEMWLRSTGTVQRRKRVNPAALLSIEIVLPTLAEQQRIVDLIDAVDTYAQKAATYAERSAQASQWLFRGLLAEAEESSETVRLGDVAEAIMGQSPPSSTYNEVGDGLPFLQGSAEFGERLPSPRMWCNAPKKVAQAGDLLVSVRAPVGDTNFAAEATAIGRGLAIVRAKQGVLIDYLALVISNNSQELARRSGSGVFASITKRNLLDLPVDLPPLTEQKRIVDVVTAARDVADQAARAASAAQALRTSLSTALLTGEHEIPESYDELLEAV